MSNAQTPSMSYPPEEKPIVDALVNELITAQTWPEVVTIARAVMNVRVLAEQARREAMQRHASNAAVQGALRMQQPMPRPMAPPPQPPRQMPQAPQVPQAPEPQQEGYTPVYGETVGFELPFDPNEGM